MRLYLLSLSLTASAAAVPHVQYNCNYCWSSIILGSVAVAHVENRSWFFPSRRMTNRKWQQQHRTELVFLDTSSSIVCSRRACQERIPAHSVFYSTNKFTDSVSTCFCQDGVRKHPNATEVMAQIFKFERVIGICVFQPAYKKKSSCVVSSLTVSIVAGRARRWHAGWSMNMCKAWKAQAFGNGESTVDAWILPREREEEIWREKTRERERCVSWFS